MTAASLDLGAVLAGPAPSGGPARPQGALAGGASFDTVFNDLQNLDLQSLADTAGRGSSDSGTAAAEPSAADGEGAPAGQVTAGPTAQTPHGAVAATSNWYGKGFTADSVQLPAVPGHQGAPTTAARTPWTVTRTIGAVLAPTAASTSVAGLAASTTRLTRRHWIFAGSGAVAVLALCRSAGRSAGRSVGCRAGHDGEAGADRNEEHRLGASGGTLRGIGIGIGIESGSGD